jgi:hypothetical protein
VFLNTESEVAGLAEVALLQLVFLDFQASLQDFFGLGTTDSDVHGNLFVSADTECSHCVACLPSTSVSTAAHNERMPFSEPITALENARNSPTEASLPPDEERTFE